MCTIYLCCPIRSVYPISGVQFSPEVYFLDGVPVTLLLLETFSEKTQSLFTDKDLIPWTLWFLERVVLILTEERCLFGPVIQANDNDHMLLPKLDCFQETSASGARNNTPLTEGTLPSHSCKKKLYPLSESKLTRCNFLRSSLNNQNDQPFLPLSVFFHQWTCVDRLIFIKPFYSTHR